MLDFIRQRTQSWLVKLAFGVIILVFVFWGVGSYDQAGPNVAATVNGRAILMRDYMAALQFREKEVRAMLPNFSEEDMKSLQLPRQVLQILISRTLVEEEAARLGMSVTPVELLSVLATVPSFQGPDGRFSQEVYEKALAAQGRNPAEFEMEAMRDLLMEKLRADVISAVVVTPEMARLRIGFQLEKRTMSYVLFEADAYMKGITITDEAVKAYYDANQPQFAEPAKVAVRYLDVTPMALAASMTVTDAEVAAAMQRGPQRYNLRQIILSVPAGADEAGEGTVRKKLEAIAAEVRGGKDFAEVAKEKSEDPSGAVGGEIGWVPARQLSESILGALAGLKKSQVTAPVRVGTGYALFQLVDSDPDWSLPEEGLKAALRHSLGTEKASLVFRDLQTQAEDMVALGRPLEEIAKELKLEVLETAATPLEELAFALGLRRPEQTKLFSGDKGSLVGALLETRDGFVVAEILERKPAGMKPLDELKALIVDVLTRREAEKKAEEAARAAMAAFASGVPAAWKDKVTTSAPFTRQGDVPGLGFARPLVDAVFAAPLNQWLKEPFATPKGAVIAMPVESIPLSDEEWATIKDRVVTGLLQNEQEQLFSAFIADLGKKAEVTLPNPEILNQ